jgi:aromatic-L-amino-acid/L-tryptophan decarboxylase
MSADDLAESGRLAEAIVRLLPHLDEFVCFDDPTRGGREREHWATRLETPLPQQGAGLDGVLDELASLIPFGVANGAPGFSAFITTGPTTSGVAASLAGTVAGSQRWFVQPFNLLETIALRWLAELLGLPAGVQGVFTSGGSVANLLALGGARQHAFERVGIDPAREGLPAGTRWRVYASSEVHHAVTRSCGVLGLGRESVASLPVDAEQRLDVAALEVALREDAAAGVLPVAIVATAGTVNTGAVDPIAPLAEIAESTGIWLHVDGAYGLFGVLDPQVAGLYDGLERADSWVVDPHKWLATPVGCGAVFVRDRDLLGRAFTMEEAEYLEGAVGGAELGIASTFDHFGEPFHNFHVEQSAPSRGVLVWAVLREIGADGIRARVIRDNGFARRLAGIVERHPELELLRPPTLSICCFRYRPASPDESDLDELNEAILRRLRAEGRFFPSSTRVAGAYAIRPCYINPRTTVAEVDGLAEAVVAAGRTLTAAVTA